MCLVTNASQWVVRSRLYTVLDQFDRGFPRLVPPCSQSNLSDRSICTQASELVMCDKDHHGLAPSAAHNMQNAQNMPGLGHLMHF